MSDGNSTLSIFFSSPLDTLSKSDPTSTSNFTTISTNLSPLETSTSAISTEVSSSVWTTNATSVDYIWTTVFTTSIFTTTLTQGGTTTNSSSVHSGVLRTESPSTSALARNTGAVIGVALSSAVALIVAVCIIFFACQQYAKNRIPHDSIDNVLFRARQVPWRPPLDIDDGESFLVTHTRTRRQTHNSTSKVRSSESGFEGQCYFTAGDQGGGYCSAESSSAGMTSPMYPVFGGQNHVPDIDQNHSKSEKGRELAREQISPGGSRERSIEGNDEHDFRPSASAQSAWPHNRSEGFLSGATRSSSASVLNHSSEGSSAGRALWAGARHMSTPSSAFPTHQARKTSLDNEYKRTQTSSSDGDKTKKLLDRLRGRKTAQNFDSLGRTLGRSEDLYPATTNLYSPSLLNPPVPLHEHAYFQSGNASNDPHPGFRPDFSNMGRPSYLWPPVTLPSISTLPVSTETLSMVEGLLHPRLGRGADRLGQASVASLRDHEDYTRPINGLVNNSMRSSTTVDGHGSQEGLAN